MRTKPLTKSRFKLGLECPNKLYYTDKAQYPNIKITDSFLESLAQGGFQVEELARMHFPNGILIEGQDGNYQHLWEQTQELLKQKDIIIYEAAFLINDLFIRTDILVKRGNNIELIEVKAKSFDPGDDYQFVGKKGALVSSWKPYLFDIAFQKYVIQSCFPDWKIKSFIMMADKTKEATVNGLNQLFRISKKGSHRTGIIKKVNSLAGTGASVLGKKDVTEIVEGIESDEFKYFDHLKFLEAVESFKKWYQQDTYPSWPTSYQSCKACEFQCSEEEEKGGLKSGFKECFEVQHGWGQSDFNTPNILDIYNFRKGGKLFDEGKLFKKDLTQELIGYKEDPNKLTTSHRQWLQIEKEVNGDNMIYVDTEGLKEEMKQWVFPLHFIDFETSAAALPFNKGLRPYEQVAFQFSHHVLFEDGRVEHQDEYISNQAGVFPNFHFLRTLKAALIGDKGTIFRYSHHENTILNAIYKQLLNSEEDDKEDLIDFIQSISHSTHGNAHNWRGDRDMVDLWEIEKNYYYNPLTKGSNSIKYVLPAALSSSKYLRQKYSKPIGEIGLSSKNFSENHIWLREEVGQLTNPYNLLPSLFEGWNDEQLESTLSELDGISDGGAALTAYAKLQYTDMEQQEVTELSNALLKYCELDTLAMVMIYEHFKELVSDYAK